jgi:hypothetical protein
MPLRQGDVFNLPEIHFFVAVHLTKTALTIQSTSSAFYFGANTFLT